MAEAAGASVAVTAVIAIGLALVHLLAGKLRLLRSVPRSIWLSAAGGVSVAYVFVHLLPEVAARQAHVVATGAAPSMVALLGRERLLFVAALAGFAVFFGLERAASQSSRADAAGSDSADHESQPSVGVFWLHIGSFAVYNGIIGYLLLHREETGLAPLALFAIAMALHFLVNDHGLADHHKDAYEHVGRWILAATVVVGFAVGALAQVPHLFVSLLMAFLAGGIVLNVVKEELPAERESRFSAFAVGVVGYTGVLLFV